MLWQSTYSERNQNTEKYLGGVTLSGVETRMFHPIICPVITDPPLLSRNPFNLACIAVIYNEMHRMKLGISMFL